MPSAITLVDLSTGNSLSIRTDVVFAVLHDPDTYVSVMFSTGGDRSGKFTMRFGTPEQAADAVHRISKELWSDK